jgi:hypothetical protein
MLNPSIASQMEEMRNEPNVSTECWLDRYTAVIFAFSLDDLSPI